jgi:electron transfer flavoprotein beta subunit
MNIVVCIKQVPGTTDVKISEKTNTLIREGVESIINPFDVYAIEEAIRIREKIGGKVTILSMGPPQAKEAIKEAIAMGADDGILLSDRSFAGSDTWATGYTLSMGIKKISAYDLIICGKQAIDGDTAQVGPGVAEALGLPFVAYVRKIEEIKDGYIRCERMMEEGYEVIEMSLPALITVVKEINEPRLPSLKGMMRAKKTEVATWTAQDLNADPANIGLTGSPTQVVKIFSPPARPGGEMILGEVNEQAEKLVTRVRELKIV